MTTDRDELRAAARVLQAVMYTVEGRDVPEDLVVHGMVNRARRARAALEAVVADVSTQRDELIDVAEAFQAAAAVAIDRVKLLERRIEAACQRLEQFAADPDPFDDHNDPHVVIRLLQGLEP